MDSPASAEETVPRPAASAKPMIGPADAKKFRPWLLEFVVVLNLLVIGFGLFNLKNSRALYETQAEMHTRNLAQALVQSIANNVDKIDISLRTLVNELEEDLATGAVNRRDIHHKLSQHRLILPEVERVSVVDATGGQVIDSDKAEKSFIALGDREYFTYLRDHPGAGLYVSKPLRSQLTQGWIIVLARRYDHANGAFGGAVFAVVSLDYFNNLLASFEVGEAGAMILRDVDCGLIARYPAASKGQLVPVGSANVSKEFAALARSGVSQAMYHGIPAYDQVARLYSFNRVSNAPMFAVAGLAEEEYLRPWYKECLATLAFLLAFAAATTFSARLIYRFWQRQASDALALHESHHHLEQTNIELRERNAQIKHSADGLRLAQEVFLNTHEAIIVTALDGSIINVNPAFTRLTGYSREEVIGQNPRLLQSGRQTEGFYQAMWQSLFQEGYWEGEFENKRKDGRFYTQSAKISTIRDEQGAVTSLIAIASDVTQLRTSQRHMEHLAYHDRLTDLPNRLMLADRLKLALAQAERRSELLGVCYIDLDGFKEINDTKGHDFGDQVLIAVAGRLQSALRAGDTVARLGGDEFVVLLGNARLVSELELAVRRLLAALALPTVVGSDELALTASVGVAIYPDDVADADLLIRRADQAMYIAKQSGKNQYHLFDSEIDRRLRERQELLTRLTEALEQGEFRLYYQPKVDMRLGTVVGAEALIRWHHPLRGVLPPADFLYAIEGTELMNQVGEWVIGEALQQMSLWSAAGLMLPVSINISGDHLQQAGFAQRLAKRLAASPAVLPENLELEILETTNLDDLELVSMIIAECTALGVRFALDDFGTGFSSLTYLRRLPTHTLKIDQSFVRDMLDDPEDHAMVESIVSLARSFHRDVIAEGVETIAHGIPLMQFGCNLAQGYGIARPMPAEQMPTWVAQWRSPPEWLAAANDFPRLD